MNNIDVYAAEMMRRELFAVERVSDPVKRSEVDAALCNLDGVSHVDFVQNGMEVSYFPQIIGAASVRSTIDRLGLHSANKKKGWLARALEGMAENNRKEFREKPLDCCFIDKCRTCK